MEAWNSVIFLKSSKSWSELSNVAKWEGVENVWSTSGEWDWCIKLDNKSSSPEKAEEFVSKIRNGNWASETKTHWWKQVSAR